MPSYARTSSLAARTRSDASAGSAGGEVTAWDRERGDEADADTGDGGGYDTAESPLSPTPHPALSAASKRIGGSSKPGDSLAHVPPAEQAPVSAYVGSSKKLKDIKDVTPGRIRPTSVEGDRVAPGRVASPLRRLSVGGDPSAQSKPRLDKPVAVWDSVLDLGGAAMPRCQDSASEASPPRLSSAARGSGGGAPARLSKLLGGNSTLEDSSQDARPDSPDMEITPGGRLSLENLKEVKAALAPPPRRRLRREESTESNPEVP